MTTSNDQLKIQPTWAFLFSHPAHFLSFGFGAGLVPKGPGTAGTLVAFPMYWYLAPRLTEAMFLLVLIWAFAFGVWVCDITGKALGVADYGRKAWFGRYWRSRCSVSSTSSSLNPFVISTRPGTADWA
jgi:phosphatidylglycerophosphatase A